MSPYEALLIAPDSKSVQYINTSHQIKKNDTGPLDSSYICFVIDQISNLYIFISLGVVVIIDCYTTLFLS